jgi:glucose uptake protein GlcU
MKWRFALRFLVTFALLVGLWWSVDIGTYFRAVVLGLTAAVSPITTGWELVYDRPGLAAAAVFRHGETELPLLLQLPALSIGLMPLLSLIAATPGQGARRAFGAGLVGAALYLLIDVVVIAIYPLIMDQPNTVKDTLGVFSGLVAFVVAPLFLWFVVTFPTLDAIWQLTPPPPSTPGRKGRTAGRKKRR